MARRRNQKRTPVWLYQLRKGKQEMASGIAMVAFLVTALTLVSLGFILVQVKDYLFTQVSKEIGLLQQDVLQLSSQNERLRAQIQMQYHRIASLAKEKYGLVESVQPPKVLVVSRKKWEHFRHLDEQMQGRYHGP